MYSTGKIYWGERVRNIGMASNTREYARADCQWIYIRIINIAVTGGRGVVVVVEG